MKTKNYYNSISVEIPVAEAYKGACNVPAWWTENLEGASEQPGDRFTVTFGDTFVTMKIAEAVPNKKIVWEVEDCYLHWLQKDKREWTGTKIEWEFLSIGHSTTIGMTHVGLVPEAECYESCEKGWNFYVKESLFKLLSEGKGIPELSKAIN
jgi:hypothetical protein